MAVISFNSNIPALQAQRRLTESSALLRYTYDRLSSGLRVVKGSDDAAGLAIASSLRVDSRVFQQGIRNLNDGISLLNITEGGVNELRNILFRLRELATQAANGTLSNEQRLSLHAEGQELVNEYNRVIHVTDFNGLRLLDGTVSNLTLQAGYRTTGQLSVSVGRLLQRTIGVDATTTTPTGTLLPRQTYDTGDGPLSFAVGDIDGDGKLDVLNESASYSSQIFLGNGNGSFRSPLLTPGGYLLNAWSVSLGDLNGDGKQDLVRAGDGFPADPLEVRLGNGNGTFKGNATFALTGGSATSLELADLNSDSKLDAIVSNGSATVVQVLMGNGNGTFKARVNYGESGGPGAMQFADLNGDGALDLAIATGGWSLTTRLGNGNGTFKGRSVKSVFPAAPTDIVLGDVTGDGKLDMIVSGNYDSPILFVGNGNGTFKAFDNISGLPVSDAIRLGDMDGDGRLDIVGAFDDGSVGILFGNGNGTFKSRASYSFADTYSEAFEVVDLNGDGVLDVLAASETENKLGVFLGGSSLSVLSSSTTTSHLSGVDLRTQSGARNAMSLIDDSLTAVANELASIGSFQSRIATAVSNLFQTRENYDAAEGRIMDADTAQETAQLVRGKILEQAASAVLAQANQLPALLLGLLTEA